jgi:aminopeptidase YwaD
MKTPALLLLAAALQSAPAAPTHPGAAQIQADVARLAGPDWQGRGAGTPGADAAAAWLAEQFKGASLQPLGDNGSYLQGFDFVNGVTLGPGNRLRFESTPPVTWRMDDDFRPLAFSSAGTVSGPVVFAGYGIVTRDRKYDDYGGLDVKDKVVLLLRYGPGGNDPHSKWAAFTALRLKVSTARDRGARAVLIATGPRPDKEKDELVSLRGDASFADAGIPALTVRRAVAEGLFTGSGTTLEAAQRKIDEGGKPAPLDLVARVDLVADVTPRRARTANVLGLLPGTEKDAEVVVVGAHYDHLGLGTISSLDPAPEGKVHPGADDNASGVSALLELARRLKGRPQRRSILFAAFGAEEAGTLGSSHFVKAPPLPLEKVAAMLNMDMVGRLREDTLDVQGTGTSPLWPRLLDEASAPLRLKVKRQEGGYGPSDHSPFYGAGKPVLFFFTGAHSDYHRPSDTADRVDAQGIARVASLVEAVLTRVAGAPGAVPFTQVAAEKEDKAPARGFRVWVGGIPDYSFEGPGVRFTGVSAGSPAEKAGMKGGDVLLRFDGKEIRNVYDYTYALGDREPGDRVPIVVKRETGEVTLDVLLGARPNAGR